MSVDATRSHTNRSGQRAGQLVDLEAGTIRPARVHWENGRIVSIEDFPAAPAEHLVPGLVDAHVHIESSMLTPSRFARRAVMHGTVATVSDPHEIANVLGMDGIEFMLRDAATVPLKFHFGVPSCVPATGFETSGAVINAVEVGRLLDDPRLSYLSEMMNYPGVLDGDPEVLAKLAAAESRGKPRDGHAPQLRGLLAQRYIAAGISTDHECTDKDEALEKIAAGANILIRQGSAARNYDALWTLLNEHPTRCMLCTDDLHPDDLLVGHLDQIVRESIRRGCPWQHVLRAACVNPTRHYGLPVGLLRVGDPVDFLVVSDLTSFEVLQTWIGGACVATHEGCHWDPNAATTINRFDAGPKSTLDFQLSADSSRLLAIRALDGQLVTDAEIVDAWIHEGHVQTDPDNDVLKITVVNRYADVRPAVAFIRGFGLRRGAIASSVAHDCHNVVAVGTDDRDLCAAVNRVIQMRGGLAVVHGSDEDALPLPVGGLMSTDACETVAAAYSRLTRRAHQMGSTLRAPFMTLSFMALLVIPQLKLSDRGLFDATTFDFVSPFV